MIYEEEDPEYEEFLESWDNCPAPDCQYKVCTWAKTGLCSPCSKQVIGEFELQRRYSTTHYADGSLIEGEFGYP